MSLRFEIRNLVVFVGLAAIAVAGMVVSLAFGELQLPLHDVVDAVFGHGSDTANLMVRTLRMPRVLTGLVVGAALGMAGMIFQAISGNPLVSPDIIGVNHGASVAVVVTVVLGGGAAPPGIVAFAGAVAAGLLVYLLSASSAHSRFRLVLIGLGVNATLGAAISFLLTRASLDQAVRLNQYLLGDTGSATWATVRGLVPAAVGLMVVGTALGRQLRILYMGEPVAIGVGSRVGVARVSLLAVGAGLAAVSVAAAGPVGFVAFISPHIARRLTGSAGPGALPVAAAVGGALVVIADYAAQRLLEPIQLPVGILTIVIAGPYFMVLLLRAARSGLL
ncbi:FecCD family ABC transporter permease [Pseudonocardia sp. GCM10023141]|uniref:FecCD family ABC transporter permease n=1 Tax=Pseudonocardia sp. GCM10023141 TaxID=3252653 RepID=UPI00362433F3